MQSAALFLLVGLFLVAPYGGSTETTKADLEEQLRGAAGDNMAESSVTSYSSVVIHHPGRGGTSRWTIGKDSNLSTRQTGGANSVQKDGEARSESYFKVFTPAAVPTGTPQSFFSRPHNHDAGIQQVEPPRYHEKQPPAGMTEELMSTLLKRQPQTFDPQPTTESWDDGQQRTKPVKKNEAKKRGHKASQTSRPDSFNVGYSIGFGAQRAEGLQQQPQETQQDVVVGKPKPFRIHVQGTNTVWKELEPGVEMSQEVERYSPQQGVLYLHDGLRQVANQAGAHAANFDHAHALGQSNSFDFSNAVGHEYIKGKSLPGFDFSHHQFPDFPKTPYFPSPKHSPFPATTPLYGGGAFYGNELGLGAPLPIQNVFIPGGKHGEGRMVQAIVIPIGQVHGLDAQLLGYQGNLDHASVPGFVHTVSTAGHFHPGHGVQLGSTTVGNGHVQGSTSHGPPGHSTPVSTSHVQGSHLGSGQIHGSHLGSGQIHGSHLNGGPPHGASIASAPVHGSHFGPGPIHGTSINSGHIHGASIGSGSIHGSHIGSGPIHGSAFSSGPIHGSAFNPGPIHGSPIGSGPIHGSSLGSGPIHGSPLGSGPIHGTPLGSGPIHGSPLSSGPIHGSPHSSGPIHGSHSGPGAIHGAPMSAGLMHGSPISSGPSGQGPSNGALRQEGTTPRPQGGRTGGFGTKLTRHPSKGPKGEPGSEHPSGFPSRPDGYPKEGSKRSPSQMQAMLNAIMAQEMLRKNHQRSPLRPHF